MTRSLTTVEQAKLDKQWERLLDAAPMQDWDGVLSLQEARRMAAHHNAAWRRWYDWLDSHHIVPTLAGYRIANPNHGSLK